MSNFLKEACVESFQEALTAFQNGANQIELCAELKHDGLTPSIELTQQVLQSIRIPVKVMIRCRSGNFVYSPKEIKTMRQQIRDFKKLNVSQFVFGALLNNNELGIETIKILCSEAAPYPVTIHKCIDLVPNFESAIMQLKQITNVKYILTSGGSDTAENGKVLLKKMIQWSAPEITIIPAGKITALNIMNLHPSLNAKIYHGKKIVSP